MHCQKSQPHQLWKKWKKKKTWGYLVKNIGFERVRDPNRITLFCLVSVDLFQQCQTPWFQWWDESMRLSVTTEEKNWLHKLTEGTQATKEKTWNRNFHDVSFWPQTLKLCGFLDEKICVFLLLLLAATLDFFFWAQIVIQKSIHQLRAIDRREAHLSGQNAVPRWILNCNADPDFWPKLCTQSWWIGFVGFFSGGKKTQNRKKFQLSTLSRVPFSFAIFDPCRFRNLFFF